MISYTIQSNQLPALRKALRSISPDNLALIAARAAANLIREHLFNLDQTRANKLGGRRTHFYADAARSVQTPKVAGGLATITINALGLAQRWLGGTITAGVGTSTHSGGPTRYLTIPARPEAYGRTAAEFHDLVFVPATSDHPAMLVQALQTVLTRTKRGWKGREAGAVAMFWLVRSVTQRPDPSVMPTEQDIAQSARAAVQSYLARHLQT